MGIRYPNKAQFFKRLNSVAPKAQEEIGKANQKSADQFVAMAKILVPVATGRLRDSIQQERGKRSPTAIVITAGGSATTNASGYDYSLGVEFGTVDTPKAPFFYPTYRAMKKPTRARATRALKKAIRDRGFGGG